MDITVTAAADRFIRRMLRLCGEPGSGFRLVVTPGGCSGLSVSFSVEARLRPGETAHDHNGMTLFLPAQSRLLLAGVTIDFADTATETGLVLHDPKATGGSCSSSGKDALPAVSSIDIGSISRRN